MAENNQKQLPDDDKNLEARNNVGLARPDLCMDDDNSIDRDGSIPQPPHEEIPRREDNPFSFKRFLNQESRGGTRRSDYSQEGAPLLHTPEMSSVLPDFVQDHLIVEQCYLPQLPTHHRATDDRIDATVAMSLPDFLSDGPIHSQRCDGDLAGYISTCEPSTSNGHISPTALTWNETDRLQREIENLRRQMIEKSRRIQTLESEISMLHSRDHSLEKALEQTENNFRLTSRRVAIAENTVAKLMNENKILKSQLAASVTPGSSSSCNSTNQRLRDDLRGATSVAEVHLRALMSGIENLRLLAANVESSMLCTAEASDPEADPDVEGAAGPAL